jgi:hypothetical protein
VAASWSGEAERSPAHVKFTFNRHELPQMRSNEEPARTRRRYPHRDSEFNAGGDGDVYRNWHYFLVHCLQRPSGRPRALATWYSTAEFAPQQGGYHSFEGVAQFGCIIPWHRHATTSGNTETGSGLVCRKVETQTQGGLRKSTGNCYQKKKNAGHGNCGGGDPGRRTAEPPRIHLVHRPRKLEPPLVYWHGQHFRDGKSAGYSRRQWKRGTLHSLLCGGGGSPRAHPKRQKISCTGRNGSHQPNAATLTMRGPPQPHLRCSQSPRGPGLSHREAGAANRSVLRRAFQSYAEETVSNMRQSVRLPCTLEAH